MEFNYPYHLADLLMNAVFRHAVAKAAILQVRPDLAIDNGSVAAVHDRNPCAAKYPPRQEASAARVLS